MLDGIVGMTFHTLFITPLTIENVPFFFDYSSCSYCEFYIICSVRNRNEYSTIIIIYNLLTQWFDDVSCMCHMQLVFFFCKNYTNRPRNARVTVENEVVPFFWTWRSTNVVQTFLIARKVQSGHAKNSVVFQFLKSFFGVEM